MAVNRETSNMITRLVMAGIGEADAWALRRISMTLHRWHELECGDGNSYGSWCITRGAWFKDTARGRVFVHDDDGASFLEHHHYAHGNGKDSVTYTRLADRERGALRRLAKIMARYPGFASYVQGDPRGASLYVLRPGDVREGDDVSSCYTRGIAVYK